MYWKVCVCTASSKAWRSRYWRHSGLVICRYTASTMLLATKDSAVAKKPRLRLSICRSSSVRPSGDFHSAMSACIATSVGIQWLLQAARYLSHAHRYFIGSSWLTSARALIIRLSSTLIRAAPTSISPRPVASVVSTLVIQGHLGSWGS